MLNRRRFLTISGVAAGVATMGLAPAARASGPARVWTGTALGARASIRLDHPDAEAIAARAAAEIDRLEDIFSLYRADSALSCLNAAGTLAAPPFELLECLSLAGSVHTASGGQFDPTVQRLWAAHATAAAEGRAITDGELEAALAVTGWSRVRLDAARIDLAPGTALTLNGIGQGYVADRVAALLEHEGLTDILVDTGEMRALGGDPRGGDWPARLAAGGTVPLRNRALATSAPLGTTFDEAGHLGHILSPATGRPATPVWREVSVSASSAALADALSTAACLTKVKEEAESLCESFDNVRLESIRPV